MNRGEDSQPRAMRSSAAVIRHRRRLARQPAAAMRRRSAYRLRRRPTRASSWQPAVIPTSCGLTPFARRKIAVERAPPEVDRRDLAAHRGADRRRDSDVSVIALADHARRARRIDRRRLRRCAGSRRTGRAARRAAHPHCFVGCCGKACGFCLISCSTSRCSRTSTSWLDVDVEVDLDRLVGRLDRNAAASGSASARRRAARTCYASFIMLSHLSWVAG